ncbi:GH12741 [Drosophila grimshawi]|uniref:GH12741 n=1 Tax=Drosophila grimshawi TaxID=7222 RepID=B4JKV9_DROGR|nr:GH12741 [Drosophila grimshawi]
MSHRQEQMKMFTEDAVVKLVECAKRLQLSSVLTKEAKAERLPKESGQYSVLTMNEQKRNPEHIRRQLGTANRKLRRPDGDVVPSPTPPPSPRERDNLSELRDDYMETAQLIDQIKLEAKMINADMLYCAQHHRDITLVQEIELETVTRSLNSLDSLAGNLGAQLEGNEFNDIMQRCNNALKRFNDRDFIKFEGPADFAHIKQAIAN